MNSPSNVLHGGQRLWWDGRPATLVGVDYEYSKQLYSNRVYYNYTVEFNDEQGGTVVLDEDAAWGLSRSITFYEHSGFEIGDTLEIKRDGLEPNLRGRLLEIDKDAERYPYRVGEEGRTSIWFSWVELTKIHSVISRERSPRAKEVLSKLIKEKRGELEALETALEVLEYATT